MNVVAGIQLIKYKKRKEIKILDNKTNTSNYTFLICNDILTHNSSITYLKDKTNVEEQSMLEKKNRNIKRKGHN
jgi:hypothetical protein